MRVEANYIYLIYFIIALVVVLTLLKAYIPRKPYKIILALIIAVTMPSFIPGHGEIIMLIPNGAMYAVSSTEVKVLGVIFTILNFIIAWFFLYKVRGLFKDGS